MTLVMSLHGQAVKESDLTPEEQAIYTPVKSKAGSDPAVKNANEKLRILKVEKITKIDPALKPLTDKVLPPLPVSPNDLPEDEKAKWKDANSAINKDPEIVKATSDFQQARIDAMLKMNPAVKPILEKLFPASFSTPAASTPAAAPAAAPAPAAPAAPAAQ